MSAEGSSHLINKMDVCLYVKKIAGSLGHMDLFEGQIFKSVSFDSLVE